MRLLTAPEADYVTRNEFNAFLALIACAQKNMGKKSTHIAKINNRNPISSISIEISLETIYHHRNGKTGNKKN